MAKSVREKLIVFIVASLAFASCFTIYQDARAGVLLMPKDTLSRLKIAVPSNHEISFRLTFGTSVTENETIEITFSTGFASNLNGIDCEDIDLVDGVTQENLNTVAGGCGPTAALWGASVSGGKLTLTAPGTPGTYIAGSSDVTVRIGTNATQGATGDTQIVNPSIPGSYVIRIGGTFGDAKGLAVAILSSEQVGVTARVGGGGTLPPGGCATAPIIYNLQVVDITQTSARVTWETDEIATGEVNYGLTSSYTSYAPGATFVTSHSILLTGLTSDTLYHFNVSSTNLCGISTTTVDMTFTTLGGPDVLPPEVMDVRCGNITPYSFNVLWGTNEVADSRVDYGRTVSYELGTVDSTDYTLYHNIPVSGLTPDTTYHYRAISSDPSANRAVSGDFTCRTLEEMPCSVHCGRIGTIDLYIVNVTPRREERHMTNPIWSRITDLGGGILRVGFEDRGDDWDYNDFVADINYTTCDGVVVTGVFKSADWEHEVRLRVSYDGIVREDILVWPYSSEAIGATKVVDLTTYYGLCLPDVTPPDIFNLQIRNITENYAEFFWQTDEPANTVIEYGLTDAYELGTISLADLVLGHVIELYGLSPNTLYHFRVISADDSGNTTYSGDQTFRTATDTTPPANVLDFTAEATPEKTVLLTWTNPSDIDFAGVVLRRSFDGYPASPTDGELVFRGLASSWIDTDFTPADYNRTIYYTIFAYDDAGNFSSGAVDDAIIEVFVTLDVTAWPEKRWPRVGNWSTRSGLDIRVLGTSPGQIVQSGTVATGDQGTGQARFATFPPGNYDVAIKGLSHLRKVLGSVPLLADVNPVDFTEGGIAYLLAGDTKYPQDDQVNSLDLSVVLNKLNTGDEISDLNRDTGVNSLDINILIANLMKMGNP